jgi:hypothetical protein
MKTIKYILVFGAGVGMSLLVGYFGYFQYCKNNWLKQGQHDGAIRAKFLLYENIKKEFGVQSDQTIKKVLFTVKDTDVLVVEQKGIKTIRVRSSKSGG